MTELSVYAPEIWWEDGELVLCRSVPGGEPLPVLAAMPLTEPPSPCPSSDDLRHIAGLPKGGSGSSVIEIMRHAVDAASDGLRLSGA
jgi:hypothetical protein